MKLLERIDRPSPFCGTQCYIIGTTAALIAGGLAAAGSVTQGVLAHKAAGTQADASLQATREANAIAERQYNQNRADLGPYREAGYAGVSRLRDLLGIGADYKGTTSGNAPPTLRQDPYAQYKGMDFNSLVNSGDPNVSPDQATTDAWTRGGVPFRTITSADGRAVAVRDDGTMSLGDVGSYATQAPGWQSSDTLSAAPAQASVNALPDDYGSLMHDFTLSDFTADPGYEFRLGEGQQALERSASARGSLFNGGTLKDLSKYNQDFASNEFNNAYNRYQANRNTKFNQLASIAGLGQTAVGQGVVAGTETANTVGANTIAGLTGAANARASGYAATGNAINGGLNNLSTLLLLSKFGKG